MHRGQRGRQLTLPAVDDDEVRRRGEALVVVLPGPVRQAREPTRDHLCHGGEVVHSLLPPDAELAVVRLLRQRVLEDDHGADVLGAHRGRDVEALDADRKRLQVERLAQLLERLDPSEPLLLRDGSVGRERVPRVLRRELLKPPLLPSFRRADLDAGAPAFREELLQRRHVPGVARHDDLRRHGRRAAVVLQAERLDNRRRVLPADVLEMERVAVDHLPVAEWEDLHDRAVPLGRKADDVDGADRTAICGLALGEVLHRAQTVSVARRVLESLLGRGLAHLPLQLALDRLRVAREKLDHLVDDRAVVLFGDVADARRQAPVDVVVEARNPRVPSRLRPLAGTVREDTVQDVERLAHLLRVRVGAEVPDPATVPLPREHDARVLVVDGDSDVREGLVVAQPDVERRPMPFDQVLLEVEGLHLVLGHDHLDVLDPLGELLDRRPGAVARLEIGAHTRPQRLGLADVEDLTALVAEQVDARLRGQGLQLLLQVLRHAA